MGTISGSKTFTSANCHKSMKSSFTRRKFLQQTDLDPVPHRDDRRQSARFSQRLAGGPEHHAGELLGPQPADISQRPDRTAESWGPSLVQKHLHPRIAINL